MKIVPSFSQQYLSIPKYTGSQGEPLSGNTWYLGYYRITQNL